MVNAQLLESYRGNKNLVQYIRIFDKLIFHSNLDYTSNTICFDDDKCAYRPQGVKCSNRTYGLPVGSLEKTFQDHGIAKLIFKNCNDHGFVKVILNDKPIAASVGKNEMAANFVVRRRDNLTLKEEEGAVIKVFSLTVGRGKKNLYRINFDHYIFFVNNFELGNNEFRKYKYLCPHYTDEAYYDDPYYYYDYGIGRPVFPNVGKKHSK